MVIHFLAPKGVVGSAFDGISMRPSSAGDEVSDAAVFVPLVIVYVPRKYYDPRAYGLLPGFQHFRQHLLLRTGGMSSSILLLV